MIIIRDIPEQKYVADIKHVTVTADSPDLSDSVTELAYSMLKSFTPQIYMSPFGCTMYCGKTMNTLLPVMEGELFFLLKFNYK